MEAKGFVYYQFENAKLLSGDYHVIAQVKNPATQEVTPFDFKVNLNLNKQ